MIRIEDLLEEDLDKETCLKLLTIIKSRDSKKEKDEITFNRFSLEIYYKEKKVVIYDDIFFEEENPLELNLLEFIQYLSN